MEFKNEKGITLIVLIITVIVLLIIVSVSIMAGVNSQKNTQEGKEEAQVKMIQNALLERYTKSQISDNATLPGTAVSASDLNTYDEAVKAKEIEESGKTTGKEGLKDKKDNAIVVADYKRIGTNELKELGLSTQKEFEDTLTADDTYVVNYKTGEVINEYEYKNNKKLYYVYAKRIEE